MTPAGDLDRLLSAAADGGLSDPDRLTLAALLRDDPAAQAAYREYMVLDALLRWERPTAAPAETREDRRPALRAAGWAVAACLLVGFGLFAAFPREAAAGPDVVDRLADWNLRIVDAPTPDGRRERFRERAAAFAAELERADLPADERQLAAALYESARALSAEDSPVAVAERLDGMSEQLLNWMWAHSDAHPRRAEGLERQYLRFVERNVEVARRAAAAAGPDEGHRRRIEKVTDRIAKRAEARVEKETERSRKKPGR